MGIIGGSGLENPELLKDYKEIEVNTPFGKPSSPLITGKINNVDVFIISRHGKKHSIPPTQVNNRANIFALKEQGCKYILATTAVGSLRENITPGDFMIANQFIDFTKQRKLSFFEAFEFGPIHVSLAEPFSKLLRDCLIESCEELKLKHHKVGTILTIEGPRFSTRAESFMFRQFAHVINMSTSPEAILAREADVEYAVVAMATDYDCWKKREAPVTWEMIESTMKKNNENVKKVLLKFIEKLARKETERKDIDLIKSKIRTIPNFPKQGILFYDITTLLKDKDGLKKIIDILYDRYKDKQIDAVAGIESRGFIIAGILADKLGTGLVLVRKPGKLPAEKISESYDLEYGMDKVEIHKDAVQKGQRILLVDDLLATGGTALASCKLIEKLQGMVVECAFVIELSNLKGKSKLSRYPVFSIVKFEE